MCFIYSWVIGCKSCIRNAEQLALLRIVKIHQAQRESWERNGKYTDIPREPSAVCGYHLTFDQTPGGYEIRAWPAQFGVTGRRNFYSDQSGVIRQNWSAEPATAASPEIR